MKTKRISLLILIIALICLLSGIAGFVLIYEDVPTITDTKLQVFEFERIDGQTIYCKNAIINPVAQATRYFDSVRFADEVSAGNKLFVRVLTTQISEKPETFTAYTVLTSQGEYLSFDDALQSLNHQNNIGYIVLICAIMVSFIGIAVSCFIYARKK